MSEFNEDFFEELDNKIIKVLKKQNVISICRVGSSLIKNKCKDIDYLVISSNKEELKNCIKEEITSKIIAIDDSYRFEIDGFICDIALYNKDEFIYKINNIINLNNYGEQREWATGYWLPEGFMLDIIKAKVLIDKDNFIQSIIIKQKEGYNDFRKKMIERVKIQIGVAKNNLTTINEFRVISYSNLCLALLRLYNLSLNKQIISFKKILADTKNSQLSEEFEKIFSGNLEIENLDENINKIMKVCEEKSNE